MDFQLVDNFFNFNDYNILILGGNSGFGLEILKSFSNYKNEIIIVGRDQKKIDKAKNEVKKINSKRNIFSIKSNLKNENDVKKLFGKIKKNKFNREIKI